jgi:hypothetical protein
VFQLLVSSILITVGFALSGIGILNMRASEKDVDQVIKDFSRPSYHPLAWFFQLGIGTLFAFIPALFATLAQAVAWLGIALVVAGLLIIVL